MSERSEYIVRARHQRPPRPVPRLPQRMVDAFRVLMGRARAVPLETGPQPSEWSEPVAFDAGPARCEEPQP